MLAASLINDDNDEERALAPAAVGEEVLEEEENKADLRPFRVPCAPCIWRMRRGAPSAVWC